MSGIKVNEQELAAVLYDAYSSKKAVPKEAVPKELDKETAYRIQHLVTEQKAAVGNEQLKGYKISLTSQETQDLFASDSPLYGALTGPAINDGTIELESMLSPLIEIELIFIVKEAIAAEDDFQMILKKTQIAPGIEVPDSRFEDWFPKVSLGQVIADSAVAGKIVIGEPKDNVSYEQLDAITGILTFDGEELARDTSSAVLGHPVRAVKWLAEELAKHGRALEKGMAVSSGTFILPKPLQRGTYEASYEGLGSVKLEVK